MPLILRMLALLSALLVTTSGFAHEIAWRDAQQMLRVVTADWEASTGELQRFERKGKKWQPIGSTMTVSIGRNGSAWGIGLHPAQSGPQKAEGDGRAPAGVFKIGHAFGYEKTSLTALDYLALKAEHYCVDVPSSPLYNRIVDTREVGAAAIEGSTEPMRRDLHLKGDGLYRLGFVIEHNPDHVTAAGSCIFAHLWRAPAAPTAGCTAMDEAAMQTLLRWLDQKRAPVLVFVPRAAYAARADSWHLPRLD